jgi:hypothetical protein
MRSYICSINRTATNIDLLSYYSWVHYEPRTISRSNPGGDLVSTEVAGKDKRAEVPSFLVNPLGNNISADYSYALAA